jgi:hypothetical protein
VVPSRSIFVLFETSVRDFLITWCYSSVAQYPLYFGDDIDEHNRKERGKIWIRIRKRWNDCTRAELAATSPPPLMVVSMPRATDYRIVKYTTVGPRDDIGFNIWKFTEYIEELQRYESFWGHLKVFAFNTWLWRGHCRLNIFDRKVNLPLHSMTAFFWGVAVTNDFNRLPSFLLFSIGWLLLACKEAVNKDPNPWHKSKAYFPHVASLLQGSRPDKVSIAPYQQLRASSKFDAARANRAKWIKKERELLNEQQRKMEQDLQGIAGENQYNSLVDITTGNKTDALMMRFLFPLKPVLYPIQQQMRQLVLSCRMATSIVFWDESNLAFWITTASFVASVAIYKIPFMVLFVWSLRISAWVFLGPWMLLADRMFFKDSKEDAITEEERDERIKNLMQERYNKFIDKASKYQILKEDFIKTESMKSYMVRAVNESHATSCYLSLTHILNRRLHQFGSHHVRVPRFRETRFKAIPLPESYAEPYQVEDAEPIMIAERKYGQKVSGKMIPTREFEAFCARDDFEQERTTVFSMLSEQMQLLSPSRLFATSRRATHTALKGATTSANNATNTAANGTRNVAAAARITAREVASKTANMAANTANMAAKAVNIKPLPLPSATGEPSRANGNRASF